MKQCPKCQANISDTAKFCVKCGCNIKKYEEEQAQVYFCPECGTKFLGGVFCPECGFDISSELKGQDATAENDAFGDGWLSDLESTTSADVINMQAEQSKVQTEKAFAMFEYQEHTDGTYTITGLKDKSALTVFVPQGVVNIADHAFEGSQMLQVTLPEGLMMIGRRAFAGCKYIEEIKLPTTLRVVGEEAFVDCISLSIDICHISNVGQNAIQNTQSDKKLQQEHQKAEVARKAELAKWSVGKTVQFGRYYQSNDHEKEPIDWLVLEKQDDQVMLVSKHSLLAEVFYSNDMQVRWESSHLRTVLNNEFLYSAFLPTEMDQIIVSEIETSHTYSRNETKKVQISLVQDRIFILSQDENKQYFSTQENQTVEKTAYATAQKRKHDGTDSTDNHFYWLRNTQDCLSFLNPDPYGVLVFFPTSLVGQKYYGGQYTYADRRTTAYVRPAMWIKI